LTLRIPLSIYEQLRGHLEAGYPNEACGALVGRAKEEATEALQFVPMRNTIQDRPHDRYALDPLEQLKVQKDAEQRGMEIVGFAHSHPDHPPRPSRFDTDHAWPFYSYVVAAVDNGVLREARAFRLDEAERAFKEEKLEVVAASLA
jgi:proteasome lid subunit RPN8/RPN11